MTWTSWNQAALEACIAELKAALSAEMALRHRFPETWIENERVALLTTANRVAMLAGRPPLTLAEIERIEPLAIGHVDYFQKMCLYVAKLVYGLDPIRKIVRGEDN